MLCALDVTEGVVQEAADCGAQLIVAHHPLIFTSVHAVTADDTTGRALMTAIRHGISVICMHTNADCAEGGVNDVLAAALGLTEIVNMEAGENGMLGRVGNLPEAMPPRAFAAYVKERLHAGGVRFTDAGKPVRRVAVGGGACGKMMDSALGKGADAFVIGDCSYDIMQRAQALGLTLVDAGHFPTGGACGKMMDSALGKGADAFVIGDCSYDIMQRAQALGLTLVDAGHFPTENPMVPVFAERIGTQFPEVAAVCSQTHRDCIEFI